MFTIETYRQAANYLQTCTGGFSPEMLLVLGSGLDYITKSCEQVVSVPFEDIPHFKKSTVVGHKGTLTFGMLANRRVMIMQGRMHMYEGNSPEQSAFAVGVAHLCGAHTMVLTNAAGGINKAFHAGDIMLVRDQINFFDATPLWGSNCQELGTRFPDMSQVYTPRLQEVARVAAQASHVQLQEGVYFYMRGPQYETPAEIRAIGLLGGDAVGMSSVNETIAAAHCGMDVLGLSIITNAAAGIEEKALSHVEVTAGAEKAQNNFTKLMLRIIENI